MYLVRHPQIFKPRASTFMPPNSDSCMGYLKASCETVQQFNRDEVVSTVEYRIHQYHNPNVSLEKIKILGVYFVPKEERELQIWREDMQAVLSEVQDFYTGEFLGNSEIRLIIGPQVNGRKKFNEYQTQQEIEDEIRDRVLDASGDLYDPKVAGTLPGEFQSVMIYFESFVNREGAPIQSFGGWDGWAMQGAFWLDKEARTTYQYGPVNSAHEFGHTLNIPHPWDDFDINLRQDPNYGNIEGNVMGYSFDSNRRNLGLEDGYIMPEQKRKLGISFPDPEYPCAGPSDSQNCPRGYVCEVKESGRGDAAPAGDCLSAAESTIRHLTPTPLPTPTIVTP